MLPQRNLVGYIDRYWDTPDGIRLHYRDYPGSTEKPPILCLHGLTRNARDFEGVAARLAGEWRLIALDFRGRGESGHAKDAMSYLPATYVADVQGLLSALGIERFVAFGTSLGGIVTMLIAQNQPGRIAGALLNDVGPDLDPVGLARIRGYVGKAAWHPTWIHAARALAEANAQVYPRYTIEDWLRMAKRLYRLNAAGRIVLDYDMRIAEPFRMPGNEAAPDMWAALLALKPAPALIVRGARSDILSATGAQAMAGRLGKACELVMIPDCGHAPTLEEPEAVAAIDRLLAKVRPA
jgi:pimeloyl-ACP methyl ester carboxylesterase